MQQSHPLITGAPIPADLEVESLSLGDVIILRPYHKGGSVFFGAASRSRAQLVDIELLLRIRNVELEPIAMLIWLITFILILAIIFLVTEKLPLDLTAIGILVALMTTGILTPREALAGFSNPSVITIAAMFMLSRGLMRTGALGFVSERIIRYTEGNEKRILMISMLLTAIASAFINNTPVVVLFITIIMAVCCEYGLSPSKYLLPISYSSIVGGMSTLIGTSTNLIVSDLSAQYGYGAISMFELAPLGIPIMLAAMAFLYFFSPRLMPQHKAAICELSGKHAPHYLTEISIPQGSKLIGREPLSFFSEKYPSIELFEVIRGPIIHFPERDKIRIEQDDTLLVKGSATELLALLDKKHAELPHKIEGMKFNPDNDKSLIAELIIPPQSRLIGEQPVHSNLQSQLGIQVIAVKRRGIHYSEQKIRDLRLSVGDTLLILFAKDRLDEIRSKPDLIILEDVHHQIVNKKKAPLALAFFAGMIAAASLGITDITVGAVTAVFFMFLTGCLRLRDAYRAMDVQVLLVIVGTIALGTAMEKTGATKIYADIFLTPFQGQDPAIVLSAIILLTCIVTELMSNSATAVLILPIAISTALSLGVDPKPFIIGVCFGASCGFAIPIGYQTHLLVYGPGGYRFSDFLKMGIPLDLLTWLMSSFLIPLIWPF